MFEKKSRYYDIEKAFYTCDEGSKILYVRRRFIPKIKRGMSYPTHTLLAGDRLDLIAYRVMGDSEKYWLICDLNLGLNPRMYCMPGKPINIPSRQPT